MYFSPFAKQLYVAITPFLASVSSGGAVAYPTVLLQQLNANDSTIKIDFETASWMGSIHGLAAIPSVLMPVLIQWKGRKFTIIFNCIVMIVGWLLAYFATNAATILVSEAFHGFGTNSFISVSSLIITEMVSPNYRYTFIQILYINQTLTMAIDGLLIPYFHWKTISIIMLSPVLVGLVLACTLPESPYWLAYKGDFSKCKENFTWLRGTDKDSEKELFELMEKYTNRRNSVSIHAAKRFCRNMISTDFFIPALHITVLQFLMYGSGCVASLIYAIEMLKKSTGNDELASFGGFIMNLMCCLGVFGSIIFDKFFKTKSVLLWGVGGTVLFLVVASVFSYLQDARLWPRESLVGLFLLLGFILSGSVGIIGTVYPIAAALIPVRFRGLGGALLIVNAGLFHAFTLKSAPYMFLHLNLWGTYLVYAGASLCCGLFVWRYVPETKGKSIQEIDNYYRYGSYCKMDDDLSGDIMTMLNDGDL